MIWYLLKRLLSMIPTLLGITILTFFLMKLAPGDIVSAQSGEGLNPDQISADIQKQTRRLYGLDVELPASYQNFVADATRFVHGEDSAKDPPFTRQALEWLGQNGIQYKNWIVRLSTLDFGRSWRGDREPVLEKIARALPVTLALNIAALIIIYFISIPLGMYSALRREGVGDKILMFVLFLLYSLPSFWAATLMLMYFASGNPWDWFPLGGLTSETYGVVDAWSRFWDMAWHLVLPLIAMVYGGFAFLTRFARVNFLDVIHQDFIRTARAKGLDRRTVLWKHAFRNSLIAFISLLGTLLPALLGGSIILEEIFAIPGMGRLAFESVVAKDEPTIMAITTITAFLTVINVLLSDLAYAWADPRISLEG